MTESPKNPGKLDHLSEEEKEDLISSTRTLHVNLKSMSDDEIEDLLSNTKVIHTDRDMPEDTQMLHVIKLEQISKERNRKILNALKIIVLLGILACGIGLYLNHRPKAPDTPVPEGEDDTPNYSVPETEKPVIVDDTTFPAAAFREWIYHEFDADHDWHLSPAERNAIIYVNFNEDDRISDLTGIEYFNVLQGLSVNGTNVKTLNLSNNKMLQYINISNTQIKKLDLSMNPAVTEIIMSGSEIEELILPAVSKVTNIDTKDTKLTCEKSEDGYYKSCKITAGE